MLDYLYRFLSLPCVASYAEKHTSMLSWNVLKQINKETTLQEDNLARRQPYRKKINPYKLAKYGPIVKLATCAAGQSF